LFVVVARAIKDGVDNKKGVSADPFCYPTTSGYRHRTRPWRIITLCIMRLALDYSNSGVFDEEGTGRQSVKEGTDQQRGPARFRFC
jgi:hypothetical protein